MATNRQTIFVNILRVILTFSSLLPHSVIWADIHPLPPVLLHIAGLCRCPFSTNTCSMPTRRPTSLCLKDKHTKSWFHGAVTGRMSWAPLPLDLLGPSVAVRYFSPTRTVHVSSSQQGNMKTTFLNPSLGKSVYSTWTLSNIWFCINSTYLQGHRG